MTITAPGPTYVQYQGNGSATVFAAPMKIFTASDAVVSFIVNGIAVVQASGFALSNIDRNSGFSVTFAAAPPIGTTVDLRTDVAQTQGTEFANLGDYLPENTTEAFDRVVRMVQDLDRLTYLFGIHGPDTENVPWPALPAAAQRANLGLTFDTNGLPTVSALSAEVITQAILVALLGADPIVRQTLVEIAAGVVPTSYTYRPGDSLRYGVDSTGLSDASVAFQNFINASWYALTFATPWDGSAGANMVPKLANGRYQLNGTTIQLPCNITFTGTADPGGNTESHTRVIQNSTGITTGRTWLANAVIKTPAYIQGLCVANNTLYNYLTNAAGVSGATLPVWPATGSVTDGTITWYNQGACTPGDNRNTPMFTFNRATSPGSATVADSGYNATIADLEFWSVVPGAQFNAPTGAGGRGMAPGDYPRGAVFSIGVTCRDTYFRRVNFQNTSCDILIQNVNSTVALGSDGISNGGAGAVVGLVFEGCEFDAAAAHIIALYSNLDLTFRDCVFYGGVHRYVGCTGSVKYVDCRWFGNAYVDASDAGNAFSLFSIIGGEVLLASVADTFSIYGAQVANIKCEWDPVASSPFSAIVLNTCTGGVVQGNDIWNAGANATAATDITTSAGVKLIDCKNVIVTNNNIQTTAGSPAVFNNFAIITLSSVGTSQNNFINGNSVPGAYTGALYRGQNRRINLDPLDIYGSNLDQQTSLLMLQGPTATVALVVTYAATMALPAADYNAFIVSFTGTTGVFAAPTNPTFWQIITVRVKNASGGTLANPFSNGVFKTPTWVSPSTGAQRTFSFEYDGTNWVELRPDIDTVN